jgi:hypothetical protein
LQAARSIAATTRGVQYGDDIDIFFTDAINHDIRQARHNQYSGSRNYARTARERKYHKLTNRVFNSSQHPHRRDRIVTSDVVADRFDSERGLCTAASFGRAVEHSLHFRVTRTGLAVRKAALDLGFLFRRKLNIQTVLIEDVEQELGDLSLLRIGQRPDPGQGRVETFVHEAVSDYRRYPCAAD